MTRPSESVTSTFTTKRPRRRPLRLIGIVFARLAEPTFFPAIRITTPLTFDPFGVRTVMRSERLLMQDLADGSETSEAKRTAAAAETGGAGGGGTGKRIDQLRDAGGPWRPIGSVAFTCSWWPPVSRPFTVYGDEHGTNVAGVEAARRTSSRPCSR